MIEQQAEQTAAVKQSPSRKRFLEQQQPKAAPTAIYLSGLRKRVESLSATLADTGRRISHAKRASLANQLKQAASNLDAVGKPMPQRKVKGD
jgi:hypothetical protein